MNKYEIDQCPEKWLRQFTKVIENVTKYPEQYEVYAYIIACGLAAGWVKEIKDPLDELYIDLETEAIRNTSISQYYNIAKLYTPER